MKKILILIVILVISLFQLQSVSAAYDYDDFKNKREYSSIVYHFPESSGTEIYSLEDLEKESDLIIQAEVLPNSNSFTTPDGSQGVTITEVKVNNIFYKNEKLNIEVDDHIMITEPYFISVYKNQMLSFLNETSYLHLKSGYAPSEIGKEYIFFLWHSPYNYPNSFNIPNEVHEDLYTVYGPKGRYPVVNTAARQNFSVEKITEEDINIDPKGSEENTIKCYKSIYKDIVQKYM